MDQKTVLLLNELNKNFYNQVAGSFSDTRQHPWSGWKQLTPFLSSIFHLPTPTVLDLACGNGRFYHFLKENFPDTSFTYLGVDSNQKLLDLAKTSTKLTKYPPALAEAKQLRAGKIQNNNPKSKIYNLKFVKLDIVSSLINNDDLNLPPTNLVVAFGLLHHIPSFSLRLKLINTLTKALQPKGVLVVSFWQFVEVKRLKKKVVPLKTVKQLYPKLNLSDLEENDYFLGWQDKTQVVRYAHHFSKKELDQLINKVPLKITGRFQADGKEEKANQYLVWEK